MSTSYELFFQFVVFSEDRKSADASGIFTQRCLKAWLEKSQIKKSDPVLLFKRTVLSHINGTKKRRQFPKMVIDSIQQLIQAETPWPTLDDTKNHPSASKVYPDDRETTQNKKRLRVPLLSFHSSSTISADELEGCCPQPQLKRRTNSTSSASSFELEINSPRSPTGFTSSPSPALYSLLSQLPRTTDSWLSQWMVSGGYPFWDKTPLLSPTSPTGFSLLDMQNTQKLKAVTAAAAVAASPTSPTMISSPMTCVSVQRPQIESSIGL